MKPGFPNLTAAVLLAAALIATLGACGSGPSRTGRTACTKGYICQQYDYDLREVSGSTLPDGFNLGDEIAAMEDQCVADGGVPSDTCPADSQLAACRNTDPNVVFTTAYYDPGLSDTDLCNLKASCESSLGTFTAPGLTCGP